MGSPSGQLAPLYPVNEPARRRPLAASACPARRSQRPLQVLPPPRSTPAAPAAARGRCGCRRRRPPLPPHAAPGRCGRPEPPILSGEHPAVASAAAENVAASAVASPPPKPPRPPAVAAAAETVAASAVASAAAENVAASAETILVMLLEVQII